MAKIAKGLKGINACGAGRRWVGKRANSRTTWDDCPDGGWLLGLCYMLEVDRALIIAAARACAALALPTLAEPKRSCIQRGIDQIDSWTDQPTIRQVKQAFAVASGAARIGGFPPRVDPDLSQQFANTIRATIPWSAVVARFVEDNQGNLTPVGQP
jgi:hypothetical protein